MSTEQRQHIQNHYIDEKLAIPNVNQFRRDRTKLSLGKLCMIELLHADETMGQIGEDAYFEACSEAILKMEQLLGELGLDSTLFLYAFSHKSILIASSDNIDENSFLALMRRFYSRHQTILANIPALSALRPRFVVVLQPDSMVERAVTCLLTHLDTSETFLIAPAEMSAMVHFSEESRTLELLNTALTSGGVVPHYQAIRHFGTDEICMYEALIRIVDPWESVHYPQLFLPLAKKYSFYTKLSQEMLRRSLTEFRDRPESLCLNLDVEDYKQPAAQSFLLQMLAQYPDPTKIILDFDDVSDYREDRPIYDCIQRLRTLGCKIAVDHSGTGEISLMALALLRPDYIKIDGSLIRALSVEENQVIVKSLCAIAQLLDAEVVAQHVENESITEAIAGLDVSLSQGFHYDTPQPASVLFPQPEEEEEGTASEDEDATDTGEIAIVEGEDVSLSKDEKATV